MKQGLEIKIENQLDIFSFMKVISLTFAKAAVSRNKDLKALALLDLAGFPLGLENLEKWEGIFQSGKSQGILNRLEKSGKITQNTGKIREFEINII